MKTLNVFLRCKDMNSILVTEPVPIHSKLQLPNYW